VTATLRAQASIDELGALLLRGSGEIGDRIADLLAAHSDPNRARSIARLVWDLGQSIQATQILAALIGAEAATVEVTRILDEWRKAGRALPILPVLGETPTVAELVGPGTSPLARFIRGESFPRRPAVLGGANDALPAVPFEEAVQDVLSRTPKLARGYLEVQRLYTTEHAFALAKSVDLEVTMKAQAVVRRALAEGSTLAEAEAEVAGLDGWARSYGEVVYRTNVTTAYAQGRLAQAKDPAVQVIAPALMYVAHHDSATRANHLAFDGLVAGPDDPVWRKAAPPQGYQCRCTLRLVDRLECESLGVLDGAGRVRPASIPPGAFADTGFQK
jgi:SPP1 gp7 family putative phage head morphogenesis protein